jgi:hypothetical protein
MNSRTIGALIELNEGLDFGNPKFSNTRSDLLTYGVIPKDTGISEIYTASFSTGATAHITRLKEPNLVAVLAYIGDDSGIIFSSRDTNATRGSLVVQPLQSDGVTPMGNAQLWLSDAVFGAVYRRGQYTATN